MINEFCKDKPTVYFSALSASSQKNWRHCPKQFTVVKIRIVPLHRPIRAMMMRYAKKLPFLLSEVGQWWGTDSKTGKEVQLDIIGTPGEGNGYLIGSCKYRNEKIGIDELELLKKYAFVFRKDGVFHYFIFSKGGFTPALLEAEKRGEVTLPELADRSMRKIQIRLTPTEQLMPSAWRIIPN